MNSTLKYDLEQIDSLLNIIKDQSINYLNDLSGRSTSSSHHPISEDKSQLNKEGIGLEKTLAKFNALFEPLIVASSGPRYLGFVTGGSTPASIAGDWLATIYDQNTQSISGSGDVSAIIELEAIKSLRELLGLPLEFNGGFVTGATMSNFTCLATARQWLGNQLGKDFAKNGIDEAIPIYSATPHSSVVKSLSMLGIGSRNFKVIDSIAPDRESMDMDDLISKIDQLNGKPFILVTSAGTVNTVDFDDFKALAILKKKYNFWWHIDGAFGAMAACSPHHKNLVEGWEYADSITVDCHKWLNVPYENAVFFIKDQYQHLQIETFQNSNAPYLDMKNGDFNYLNFLPENSRRLKALPVLFTLLAYGKDGYQSIVENSIEMAKQLSQYIENSQYFELLAETRLNNVCFTLKEKSEQSPEFLRNLNSRGNVFMTPTIFNHKKGIRVSFVNWRTNEKDLKIIINEIEQVSSNYF